MNERIQLVFGQFTFSGNHYGDAVAMQWEVVSWIQNKLRAGTLTVSLYSTMEFSRGLAPNLDC